MRIAGIGRLLGTNKKALLTNTILIANAFIWYLYSFSFLANTFKDDTGQLLFLVTINFLGLFSALLIGEFLSHKVKNRLNFLFLWMIAGVFLSLVPMIGGVGAGGMTLFAAVLFSVITGINFGFGIPLCLGYFASTTDSVNRGKSGGIIFLLIGVGAFLISGIGDSFLSVSLILAIWRASGVAALFIVKRSVAPIPTKTKIPYKEILGNRTFLLYFIPWLMFLIVNNLSFPINETVFGQNFVFGLPLVRFSSNVEFVLGGFSAVIFGFFADSKGRKRLAVIGFALLGLGYAVLAFTSLGATEPNIYGWWFYTFVDGITWGSFVMLFFFAIWGDIAEGRSSERIYAIAIVPYLLSSLIRLSLGEYLATIVTIENFASTFSFFSFFLFIAVLPLVLAPETLSDQTIKNNELRNYIDKAQKQVSKIKKKKTEPKDEKTAESESEEQSDEIKKAQELAEKYY